MVASDYLKRSALYRKLAYDPRRGFARVYAAKMTSEGLGRRCTWRSLNLFRDLGSGLIGQSQKMTVAATQIADMKVWAQRS